MNAATSEDFSLIEAEQILLGTVLINNDAFYRVSAMIEHEHFAEPLHQRIWAAIRWKLDRDEIASPVSLRFEFEDDPAMKELGGAAYLVRLAGVGSSPQFAAMYAKDVLNMHQRRVLARGLREALDALKAQDGVELAKAKMEGTLVALPTIDGRANTVSFLKAATDAISQINTAYGSEGEAGLGTGLRAIDSQTGGLWPSDLVILGGRPSMGKTALASSIALRIARRNKRVAICSLEMTETALAMRMLAELSNLRYSDLRTGNISEDDFRKLVDRMKANQALPIGFIPPHVRDVTSLHAAVKAERARMEGLDLVVVDYLQLVRGPGKTRYEQMTEVSIQLKHMAKSLNVPVLALAQLSRSVEQRDDKRPMLSDLRESGQIEQDADAVLFCYRDQYYLERQTAPDATGARADYEAALAASRNRMEVIVAKQRMGAAFTAEIGCHLPTNRFWDIGDETEGFQ